MKLEGREPEGADEVVATFNPLLDDIKAMKTRVILHPDMNSDMRVEVLKLLDKLDDLMTEEDGIL